LIFWRGGFAGGAIEDLYLLFVSNVKSLTIPNELKVKNLNLALIRLECAQFSTLLWARDHSQPFLLFWLDGQEDRFFASCVITISLRFNPHCKPFYIPFINLCHPLINF